ncbi:YopX family protein [Bacillus pumilus]|uniref:YopX family protein n=1 Tax=Bacillus pumilus TaxID=1408 RepID=UPI0031F55544
MDIVIRYVFMHRATRNLEIKRYSTSQLEERSAQKLSPCFDESEYELIARNLFTGLKDKNGVEIYESDIALDPNKNIKGVICYDCHQARYKFVPLSLYHSNAGDGGWSGFELNVNRRLPEVIGNIYQNPDLLEGAE